MARGSLDVQLSIALFPDDTTEEAWNSRSIPILSVCRRRLIKVQQGRPECSSPTLPHLSAPGMRKAQDGCSQPDEETALLASPERKPVKAPTPLPKLQIFILLLMQLAEPITSQCIYPFINQV